MRIKETLINSIKEAVKNDTVDYDGLNDNVEMLGYHDENGEYWNDRFNYVDQYGMVHFIWGTDTDDHVVPLSSLTYDSLNKIAKYI